MKLRIALYGRLRDAGLGESVSVVVPDGATARQAMSALKTALGKRAALLSGCALATGDEILGPNEKLPSSRLAALPPVCGG